MKAILFVFMTATMVTILSACQSATATATPPTQTHAQPTLSETIELTLESTPTPSLTVSPVPIKHPIINDQPGNLYDTLFIIPVGENSILYHGRDHPDMEINGPNAIAVLPDGSFVIADLVGNCLWRYDYTGQLLKSINLNSIGIEQVTYLRATDTELFLLEIRAEKYRVNRLSFDGEIKAIYPIPKALHIENGLTGIIVDCEGEILLELESGTNLHHLVDAQGNLNPSIAKSDYHCNGRPYRVINPGPGKTPMIIAREIRLESKMTTGFGGFHLINVLQDGSFFMIREDVVNDQAIQVDQTVHYIDADGTQQGVARVPIAEYYYYIMRNMAVGPDSNVYALFPQPDSIHIIRLNFYKNIEPLTSEAVEPLIMISTTNP